MHEMILVDNNQFLYADFEKLFGTKTSQNGAFS